jgi:hypothetical protein
MYRVCSLFIESLLNWFSYDILRHFKSGSLQGLDVLVSMFNHADWFFRVIVTSVFTENGFQFPDIGSNEIIRMIMDFQLFENRILTGKFV